MMHLETADTSSLFSTVHCNSWHSPVWQQDAMSESGAASCELLILLCPTSSRMHRLSSSTARLYGYFAASAAPTQRPGRNFCGWASAC